MQKMTTTEKRVAVGSLGYQIIQEIKNLRLLKGYSQAYVAKEIGVSKRQMGRYEEGRDSLSPKKLGMFKKVCQTEKKVIN